jgi:hypothetical protein
MIGAVTLCYAANFAFAQTAPDEPVADKDDLHMTLDTYVANLPGERYLATGEAAVALGFLQQRADYSIRIDAAARGSWVSKESKLELRELTASFPLPRKLQLDLGRLRVNNDYWLVADGAALRATLPQGFTLTASGGLRSLSSTRQELVLRAHPTLIPLVSVGGTWENETDWASVSANRTEELVVEQQNAQRKPDTFFDAAGFYRASDTVSFVANASVGTQFTVNRSSNPLLFEEDASVKQAIFKAATGFVGVDINPSKTHRFFVNALATRERYAQTVDDVATLSGSFAETSMTYRYRPSAVLSASGRGRVRYRDGQWIVRPSLAVTWGQPKHRALSVTAAFDANAGKSQPAPDTLSRRAFFVDVNGVYLFGRLETKLGIHHSDSFASTKFTTLRENDPPSLKLFPLVLEAQRYAYAQLFYQRGTWFASVDLEASLDERLFKSLIQVGVVR